jgi:hypothetical protein
LRPIRSPAWRRIASHPRQTSTVVGRNPAQTSRLPSAIPAASVTSVAGRQPRTAPPVCSPAAPADPAMRCRYRNATRLKLSGWRDGRKRKNALRWPPITQKDEACYLSNSGSLRS